MSAQTIEAYRASLKALEAKFEEIGYPLDDISTRLIATIAFNFAWHEALSANCADQIRRNEKWLAPVVELNVPCPEVKR